MPGALYDRRRARLGLDDEGGVGIDGENELMSDAIQARLNTPPPAAVPQVTRDAVANRSYRPGGEDDGVGVVTPSPGTSRTLPRGDRVRDQTGDATADPGVVDTGVGGGTDAGIDTGVDVDAPTMEWRKSLGYGDQGTLIGFRTDGYEGDDEEANTVKNTFGKIASRYRHTPDQVDAILNDPDFRRAFPNATKVEGGANDKIDFGGVLSFFDHGEPVGVVDVQKAADPTTNTSEGWTWQPDGGGGVPMDGGVGGAGGGYDPSGLEGLAESDQLAAILAQIDALAEGQNPAETDAIRRLLESGA